MARHPLVNLDEVTRVPCRERRRRTEPWRQICIHEAQTRDWGSSGLAIANYLRDPKNPDGSNNVAGIHYSVGPYDVAESADPFVDTVPHCYRPSSWSVGVEHTGYTGDAVPTPDAVMCRSASLAGGLIVEWEARYAPERFALVHLYDPELVAGKTTGFISHWDATVTCDRYGWPTIGHHYDGRDWDWPPYLDMVADDLRVRRGDPPPPEGDEMAQRVAWLLAGSEPRPDGLQAYVEVDPNDGTAHGWHGVTFEGVTPDEALGGELRTVDFVKLNGGMPIRAFSIDEATGRIFAFGQGTIFRVWAVAG